MRLPRLSPCGRLALVIDQVAAVRLVNHALAQALLRLQARAGSPPKRHTPRCTRGACVAKSLVADPVVHFAAKFNARGAKEVRRSLDIPSRGANRLVCQPGAREGLSL